VNPQQVTLESIGLRHPPTRMSRRLILFLAVALLADAQPAALHVTLIEGEGAVYPAGSRATHGVTVKVTDETGRPVEGATVSFSLPSDGPGGVFASGARTEVATTHADGEAAAWGMQWNRTPGPFGILITAAKGPARGGVTCSQSLAVAAAPDPRQSRAGPGGHKWLWITLAVVAGAAGAGVAAVAGGKTSAAASGSSTAIQIGAPTISLGRP
jgi:hypothetical protein